MQTSHFRATTSRLLLLASILATFATSSFAAPKISKDEKTSANNEYKTTEPYELMGNRLVFTSWLFIRPGTFAWIDDKGANVSVKGDQGDWGAHFVRQGFPQGIRLRAQPAEYMGPIIESDGSDKPFNLAITTLLKDGDTYKAWGMRSGGKGDGPCYFESNDGLHWHEPDIQITVNDKPADDLNIYERTL